MAFTKKHESIYKEIKEISQQIKAVDEQDECYQVIWEAIIHKYVELHKQLDYMDNMPI